VVSNGSCRVSDCERRRVSGVGVAHRDSGSAEHTVAADLVVDATGRGSRTRARLRQPLLPIDGPAGGIRLPAQPAVVTSKGTVTVTSGWSRTVTW